MTDIKELKSLPVEQAAYMADCRLRQIEQEFKANFAELGAVLLVSRERELWRYATALATFPPPNSFTEWIMDCLPVSNGSAFAALRVAEKLSFIPLDERAQIPRSNLERMVKVSSGVLRDPTLRLKARQLSPSAFADFVEREYPEQHLPADVVMRFRVSAEVRDRVELAIKHMRENYGCGRDEAFGLICEAYLMEIESATQASSD